MEDAEILGLAYRHLAQSETPVSFTTTGAGSWKVWNRYLAVNGAPAQHIGNICGTCEFFFEKLDGAAAIDVGALSGRLAAGIEELDGETLDALAQIVPGGTYHIALLCIVPFRVIPAAAGDYFVTEQPENRGWADADELNDPGTAYYRVRGRSNLPVGARDGRVFEFVVPMVAESALSEDRIQAYAEALRAGSRPTAVAVSVLDIKVPDDATTEHWCIAHYLLDGHHKLAAAARTGMPVTLIAFIAVEQGISAPEDVDALLATYQESESAR